MPPLKLVSPASVIDSFYDAEDSAFSATFDITFNHFFRTSSDGTEISGSSDASEITTQHKREIAKPANLDGSRRWRGWSWMPPSHTFDTVLTPVSANSPEPLPPLPASHDHTSGLSAHNHLKNSTHKSTPCKRPAPARRDFDELLRCVRTSARKRPNADGAASSKRGRRLLIPEVTPRTKSYPSDSHLHNVVPPPQSGQARAALEQASGTATDMIEHLERWHRSMEDIYSVRACQLVMRAS